MNKNGASVSPPEVISNCSVSPSGVSTHTLVF